MSEKMKPIIILPPGQMVPEHQELLRQNGLCIVEAKEPLAIKFLDPIPAMDGRDKATGAAIALSRRLLNWRNPNGTGVSTNEFVTRSRISEMFAECLIQGTELSWDTERAKAIYDSAKDEEIRKLAREDARAERAKKKAAESQKD